MLLTAVSSLQLICNIDSFNILSKLIVAGDLCFAPMAWITRRKKNQFSVLFFVNWFNFFFIENHTSYIFVHFFFFFGWQRYHIMTCCLHSILLIFFFTKCTKHETIYYSYEQSGFVSISFVLCVNYCLVKYGSLLLLDGCCGKCIS